MRAHGFEPEPNRGKGTWHEFIKTHAETMWACDFFTKQVWSPQGMQDHYVLFFKHIGTRQVFIAGATPNPNKEWVTQQARNFSMHLQGLGMPATYVIRDNDTKFLGGFDTALEGDGIEVVRSAVKVPEMNGYAETFVKTIKNECLDHFMAMGYGHLMHLLSEYVNKHYVTTQPFLHFAH